MISNIQNATLNYEGQLHHCEIPNLSKDLCYKYETNIYEWFTEKKMIWQRIIQNK